MLGFVSIYDLAGRLVQTNPLSGNPVPKIDIGSLASGIYFIRIVKNDGGTFTSKFVKE